MKVIKNDAGEIMVFGLTVCADESDREECGCADTFSVCKTGARVRRGVIGEASDDEVESAIQDACAWLSQNDDPNDPDVAFALIVVRHDLDSFFHELQAPEIGIGDKVEIRNFVDDYEIIGVRAEADDG